MCVRFIPSDTDLAGQLYQYISRIHIYKISTFVLATNTHIYMEYFCFRHKMNREEMLCKIRLVSTG